MIVFGRVPLSVRKTSGFHVSFHMAKLSIVVFVVKTEFNIPALQQFGGEQLNGRCGKRKC